MKIKFVDKYKGAYTKEFDTLQELDEWIEDHVDIMEAYVLKEGKWIQI